MTPLEASTRLRLTESYASVIGSGPQFTKESVAAMIDDKIALVLPVLKESFPDEGSPTLDQIHKAEFEATRRRMKDMTFQMSDPAAYGVQKRAEIELNAVPEAQYVDPQADELERRLAELEQKLADGN